MLALPLRLAKMGKRDVKCRSIGAESVVEKDRSPEAEIEMARAYAKNVQRDAAIAAREKRPSPKSELGTTNSQRGERLVEMLVRARL